jgi:FkbM family methyltransferase
MSFRKPLGRVINRTAQIMAGVGRRVYVDPQAARSAPWFAVNGDKTLRLDYDLNPNSVVFDIGGYEGQFASDIVAASCATVHVFEPVPDFAAKIARRFRHNPKVHVHAFGLAGTGRKETISVSADASSVMKSGNNVEIELVSVLDFIRDDNITQIDLMKINIEGGEYELLESLIDSGFVKNIRDIQVQFHDFFPNAEKRMQAIQNKLNDTHGLTYQYVFVWENWRRKDQG